MLESDYYIYLKSLKAAGKIYDFEVKPVFLLIPAFKKNGKQYRDMEYIGDFKVMRSNKEDDFYIVDTKGFKTDVFQIKEKLFHYFYRDIELLLLTFDGPTEQWVTLEEHKKLVKERKKERAKKKAEKEAIAVAKKAAKAAKPKKGRKKS